MHTPLSVGSDSRAPQNAFGRLRSLVRRALPASRFSPDAEVLTAAAVLGAALVAGLATAADYGVSIDEFNANDYGPKALAWYTSGFTDRSHFENVEFSLWYYGPWFQILTAFVQSFNFGDGIAVRHALTFLVGLGGVAALLPIGRLAVGRWAGTTAIVLCLITGYFYGNLFFAPIDVPFMAAMAWATLAILVMVREPVPSWRATIITGLLVGLALGTRTGGLILQAYMLLGLALCAVEFAVRNGGLRLPFVLALAARYIAAIALAWLMAIAIWPWLELGNPIEQFRTALVYFATIPVSFDFQHWGERVSTNALARSYIPGQLLARLPLPFLGLLVVAAVAALAGGCQLVLKGAASWRAKRSVRSAFLLLAQKRAILIVWAAVICPLAFLILQRATLYDGVRHVLFVIPMLAIVAGEGAMVFVPWLRRSPVLSAIVMVVIGAYLAGTVRTLAILHPLEYVAMNALVGGTYGAYGRFDLDYWSMAAQPALRRLEERLDHDHSVMWNESPPSLVICIPWREGWVGPMLRRPWKLETDPDKADYIIVTERARAHCASRTGLELIDELKRFDRPFAWTYRRHSAQ
jgi:hypothetical protein